MGIGSRAGRSVDVAPGERPSRAEAETPVVRLASTDQPQPSAVRLRDVQSSLRSNYDDALDRVAEQCTAHSISIGCGL